MFLTIVSVLIVALLAAFFIWLTVRAFRSRRPALKWIGGILSGLLSLVLVFVSALAILGVVKFYTPKTRPAPELKVEGTPEQIARGQHLAAAFCVECHSTTADFPMTGGVDLGADLPMNLGKFVSVNLTPAGPLKDWTDGEIFRAIRDNVDRDGGRLVFMAGTNVRNISDEDIHALIAFLRSQPAVEKPSLLPPDRPSLLGAIMVGANILPDRPLVQGVVSGPPMAASAEYGQFMTTFLDCSGCHGDDFTGGTSPIGPKGPSLRVVKGWTQQQFIDTLRTGKDPQGDELKPPMPWKSTGRLDDVELAALYTYLVSLP